MSEQPHSPQTAPIDEYRVLWTNQKKQKLKRWHDGFLRFHKFNKRMLVYDDARHLVADMYLRDRDAIGEGDDLEFEHHLVTIEDFKGTVVQDLTPIFSLAAQRKQLLQTGNALLNSPTPNLANRHGPWGPSPHATPTPQSVQQRRPMAIAGPPQSPVQQRPISTPDTTLHQSIRANNNTKHPHLYQNRPPRLIQPPRAPANVPTSIEPSQKLSTVSGPNPPSIPHPPLRPDLLQRQNRPSGPIQEQRQPWSSPAPTAYTSNRPPSGGLPSPTRRLKPPPPAPLQKPRPPSPRPNNVRPCLPPPRVNQRPIATLDLEGFSDTVRLSSDMKSSLLPVRPTNIFSHPIPPHANKSTPNVTIGIDSDEELFGSPPEFQVLASPPRPVSMPLARQSSVPTDSAPIRTQKWSSDVLGAGDPRASRPPSKRKTTTLPEKPQQRSSETVVVNVDKDTDELGKDSNPRAFRPTSKRKITTLPESPQARLPGVNMNDGIVSQSGEESEKEPSEPLMGAGTLRLGTTTKRKRNRLLCQRPLNISAAAPKELPARSTGQQSARDNPTKKSKVDSVSEPLPPESSEKTEVIEDDAGTPPIMPPPAIKKRIDGFKFQGPKRARKSIEGQGKGKNRASGPTPAQEHRTEEKEDTIEYQQENDIGPWSSEASDLFGWRLLNMGGKK